METSKFLGLCKENVVSYNNETLDKKTITTNDVCIVWLCKTLQNNKVLMGTMLNDGMYYELTYNGDRNELYLDVYKKFENICIPLA